MSDDIIHRIERQRIEQHHRVRNLILAQGRPDIVAELDKNMREIHLGTMGARNTWQALSAAQRRVLMMLVASPRRLVRGPGTANFYDAVGEPHVISRAAGLRTVRNLAARELLEWTGGAFDPERSAVLTERGRFVAAHGEAASIYSEGDA